LNSRKESVVQTSDVILSWRGRDLYDREGQKIGRIEEIYLDQETDRPEWALVNTGLFGTKSTFVPITDASSEEDGVRVPFDKDDVKDAPGIDAESELSQQQEAELYRHYGMDYGESRSETGLPEGERRAESWTATSTYASASGVRWDAT
jgi:sporulation protein YlmC with PRC-barrel domain